MRKITLLFLWSIISAFATHSLSALVEHSITPQMEKFENIENITPSKFGKKQYKAICDLLQKKESIIRVVSFNTLCDLYEKNSDKKYQFRERLPRIVEVIQEMDADVIGTQELLPHLAEELIKHIGDRYILCQGDKKKKSSEAVLIRKDRFSLVESKFLEMTSSSGSLLTLVMLRDHITDKKIALINVHLAFGSAQKREEEAIFIAKTLKKYAALHPVILTGDLNTFAPRLDISSLPYFDGNYIMDILIGRDGCFKDACDAALLGHIGPISSFTNKESGKEPFSGLGTPGIFLDHIIVSNQFKVILHATQPAVVDGYFPSDHMPIIADIIDDSEDSK